MVKVFVMDTIESVIESKLPVSSGKNITRQKNHQRSVAYLQLPRAHKEKQSDSKYRRSGVRLARCVQRTVSYLLCKQMSQEGKKVPLPSGTDANLEYTPRSNEDRGDFSHYHDIETSEMRVQTEETAWGTPSELPEFPSPNEFSRKNKRRVGPRTDPAPARGALELHFFVRSTGEMVFRAPASTMIQQIKEGGEGLQHLLFKIEHCVVDNVHIDEQSQVFSMRGTYLGTFKPEEYSLHVKLGELCFDFKEKLPPST
mmetsp:Transcript_21300/g.37278  ORF Transcript_21300/g.37278 Transcript_21300/m.37278 type:complete len:256 (+) Transcript_21300:143-910(+)